MSTPPSQHWDCIRLAVQALCMLPPVHAPTVCELTCESVLLCLEDSLLGVIHPLWLLQSFCLIFCRQGWVETSYLKLSDPKSLTLCTLSSRVSLCQFPHSENGCFLEEGWWPKSPINPPTSAAHSLVNTIMSSFLHRCWDPNSGSLAWLARFVLFFSFVVVFICLFLAQSSPKPQDFKCWLYRKIAHPFNM